MPGVFVLVMFPTLLLGALLVILSLGLTGAAAVSMVLLLALLGVVFVSLAVAMLRQHPSHDGGDRRRSEDGFAAVEKSLDDEAVPEEIGDDDDDVRDGRLDRWDDDGGWRSPIGLR